MQHMCGTGEGADDRRHCVLARLPYCLSANHHLHRLLCLWQHGEHLTQGGLEPGYGLHRDVPQASHTCRTGGSCLQAEHIEAEVPKVNCARAVHARQTKGHVKARNLKAYYPHADERRPFEQMFQGLRL